MSIKHTRPLTPKTDSFVQDRGVPLSVGGNEVTGMPWLSPGTTSSSCTLTRDPLSSLKRTISLCRKWCHTSQQLFALFACRTEATPATRRSPFKSWRTNESRSFWMMLTTFATTNWSGSPDRTLVFTFVLSNVWCVSNRSLDWSVTRKEAMRTLAPISSCFPLCIRFCWGILSISPDSLTKVTLVEVVQTTNAFQMSIFWQGTCLVAFNSVRARLFLESSVLVKATGKQSSSPAARLCCGSAVLLSSANPTTLTTDSLHTLPSMASHI